MCAYITRNLCISGHKCCFLCLLITVVHELVDLFLLYLFMGSCKQFTYRVPTTDKHTSTKVQFVEPLSLLVCLRTMGGRFLTRPWTTPKLHHPSLSPKYKWWKLCHGVLFQLIFHCLYALASHIFKSVDGGIANWWFNIRYFAGTLQGIFLFIRILLLLFRISYNVF